MKKIFALVCLISAAFTAFAQTNNTSETEQTYPMEYSTGFLLGDIPALRDLDLTQSFPINTHQKFEKKNYFGENEWKNLDALPKDGRDALLTMNDELRTANPQTNHQSPLTINRGTSLFPGRVNMEGNRDPGGTYPPDPTGDVGKNHYMQAVNGGGSRIRIWNKQGTSVMGPFNSSAFWNQVGAGSVGDPIVQYDPGAERWLFLEMQGGNELLIAISASSDPTGAWKAYRFQTNGFPDYPKLAIWHNAYVITVNELVGGNTCTGYALERSKMLAGEAEFGIYRFQLPNFQGVTFQPGVGMDWEGGTAPPANSAISIFRMYDDAWGGGSDALQIWRVNLNWSNVSQSSFSGPTVINVAPFESRVCWGWLDCIEQPDANEPRITAMENILMYRVPYRNFGTHESVVMSHVSEISNQTGDGGDAGIRWYELRRTPSNQNWTIYQQGTYAPDLVNRWMSTLSIDADGNIGMGYSVCNATDVYPGLRMTGRRNGEALGLMTVDEYSLIEGGQSHSTSRWGDYSSMSVDPSDGRTFWFTGEYQPENGLWGTRIGSFTLRRDTFDVAALAFDAPLASAFLGNSETVKARIFNEGLEVATNVRASLFFEGILVATEQVVGTIQPGTALTHTFAPTVNMSEVGRDYEFMLITHYNLDQFAVNDTFRTTVKKLTSNDAGIFDKTTVQGMVCASEYTFQMPFKNTSGVALTSLKFNWKLGANAWQTQTWTGNLAPNALDTMPISVSNIVNGLNALRLAISEPNGQLDEDRSNDSLSIRVIGNLNGAPLTAVYSTIGGKLRWEVRNQNTNQLLFTGESNNGQVISQPLCLVEGECYRVVLDAIPADWTGSFKLFDVYGNPLVQRGFVGQDETIDFCVDTRLAKDVGPIDLISPQSAPTLSATETVQIAVRNFGLDGQTAVPVSYRIGNGAWHNEVLGGTLQKAETQYHTFANTENMSQDAQDFDFEIVTNLSGDLALPNDTLRRRVSNIPARDLELVKIEMVTGCNNLDLNNAKLTIRNRGYETINSFKLKHNLNGVDLPDEDFVATIFPNTEQTFGSQYFTAPGYGTHTYEAEISNSNNLGADARPNNDAGTGEFITRSDAALLSFFLAFDGNKEQTSWELLDDEGNVIFAGNGQNTPETFLSRSFCFANGECYVFRLFDSGNDGMQGTVSLNDNTGSIAWTFSGGNFGDTLVHNFCISVPCAGFLGTTEAIQPTSGQNDGQIIVHLTGGTPPYLYSLDNNLLLLDSVFQNLPAGDYTVYVWDADGCTFQMQLTLGASTAQNLFLKNRKLTLLPNPVTDFVRLELPAIAGEKEAICEVFDANGKFLFSDRMARWDDTLRGMFSVQKLVAGNYFVRVRTSSGQQFGLGFLKQ